MIGCRAHLRHFLVPSALLAAAALVGCNSDSTSTTAGGATDTCPRAGVVPAQLRDVERNAEGVSYSVFGAYPDRAPDFTRATGVLSLLSQNWSDGKALCPGLPEAVTLAIDTSIASLTESLAKSDQPTSSYAANDIHEQMAPLFAYFNPDAAPEIVEMDAYFLRIGLDAWFEDWSAFGDDLSRLQQDWSTLKPLASSRVPTCHRVAGTASVVSDLDDTLANLETYATSHEVDASQVESEAGLLEVDILELLFDCVPDGTAPSTGVGSHCTAQTDCGAGHLCDLDNAGGTCAPDAANTHVGEPCTTTAECGTDPRDACNSEVGDGYPGGYCAMEPCDDVHVCSPGATCVALPFETPSCMLGCAADVDCRVAEGYVCQLFVTTPPTGFGPSDHACAFACKDDAGCTPPLTCDVASGKCTP